MSLLQELGNSLVVQVIVAIVAPILAGVIFAAIRYVYRAQQALRLAQAALGAVVRTQQNGLWTEGPGFWLKLPIKHPANYDDLRGNSIPVLMIATSKGGVGKTTLSGSLAAHFAMQWTQRRQDQDVDRPLRVLLIDQDFQGSQSTMTVSDNSRFAQPSKANRLVSGELGDGELFGQAEPISREGMVTPISIRTIPAYYDLAQAENRTIIEWLLPLSDRPLRARLMQLLRLKDVDPPRSLKDVRYLLAEALLHPRVQANFDLVIIDAPPRLTTSHMQAMCASTHLLVPTALDGLAGDAVARYLDQVATHKLGLIGDASRVICPHLQVVGVVCTLLPGVNRDLSGPLNELRQRIAAARIRPDILPEECFIRQRTPYRECAGEKIAYAATTRNRDYRAMREEVDRLGDVLAHRLGASHRGWARRLGERGDNDPA